MRDKITATDLANTVRMIRSQFKGTLVVTEGDTDVRVFKQLFSKKSCRFVPSNGKVNALQATVILERDRFAGLLTIVDADFDHLESVSPPSSNVLFSDTHDLETMILASPALGRVLSELVTDADSKGMPVTILDLAFLAARPIGCFRWQCSVRKDNNHLKFDGIDFTSFVQIPSFQTDVDNLVWEVLRNTDRIAIDEDKMKLNIQAISNGGHDKWQLCSGHDLVQMIYLALKHVYGNNRVKLLTLDLFDAMLRVAYDMLYFTSSKLFKDIQSWQSRNLGFQVL